MTTTSQLTEYLRAPVQQQALLRTRTHFAGVFAADQLPDQQEIWLDAQERGRNHVRLIMNYSDLDDPSGGSHWCGMGLYKDPSGAKKCEYFDSYATGPDQDDSILAKLEGHPMHTHFREWLKAWGPAESNRIRLQASGSDVCGLYSAYFVLHGLPRPDSAWKAVLRHQGLDARDAEIARLVRA